MHAAAVLVSFCQARRTALLMFLLSRLFAPPFGLAHSQSSAVGFRVYVKWRGPADHCPPNTHARTIPHSCQHLKAPAAAQAVWRCFPGTHKETEVCWTPARTWCQKRGAWPGHRCAALPSPCSVTRLFSTYLLPWPWPPQPGPGSVSSGRLDHLARCLNRGRPSPCWVACAVARLRAWLQQALPQNHHCQQSASASIVHKRTPLQAAPRQTLAPLRCRQVAQPLGAAKAASLACASLLCTYSVHAPERTAQL